MGINVKSVQELIVTSKPELKEVLDEPEFHADATY